MNALRYICIGFLIILQHTAIGQSPPTMFQNPIIPGGHPDPSICRVGEDYYLVNSSFIWYPGVPIYHSKDLVNWALIGHAFETPENLDIGENAGVWSGLWAPTIRYHEGLFYITVTQRSAGSSVLVTATDPAGDWSKPVHLHSSNGIDGSLLFDDQNVWYTWSEDHMIWFQEFDKEAQKLLGDKKLIMDELRFEGYTHIEGPHIYKLESGEYMLLIAAGGTGSDLHNVSVFKSENPGGPYMPCPNNPVLTHYNYESEISIIGHADIVQTQHGEWYAVMLGVRKIEGKRIMGRETFLTSFVWEDGWPKFNPDGGGKVLPLDKRPNLPWSPLAKGKKKPERDDFNHQDLHPVWHFYHTPHEKWWDLEAEKGVLSIQLQPTNTTEQKNIPVIARKITQADFEATTELIFDPANEHESAGLIAMMNQNGQYRLQVTKKQGEKILQLVRYSYNRKQKHKIDTVLMERVVQGQRLTLALHTKGLEYQFKTGEDGNALKNFGPPVDGSVISVEMAGGYSGAYVGMFGTSNGTRSGNQADFDWFEYKVSKNRLVDN